MEDYVSNKTYLLLVFVTFFFCFSCSHSPTHTSHSSVEVPLEKQEEVLDIADENLLPDFIVPPISSQALKLPKVNTVSNNTSIWQHIAKNFALSEFFNHPRVVKQKQKYLNKPNYLADVTQRSETFIHFVLSEVERRNLPAELVILPMVESNYFPKARSRARAVGLWQFMPYTAKEYGLKRTYSYDGRHDVYASTIAALDYLEQLNKKFDGNWLLTLAAYNAGPHRINRALKTSSIPENENAYWNLKLPRETCNYIPKILALSSIVNDLNLSETLLHPIEDKSFIEPVAIKKRISPAKLVQASGISADELHKLNPALRFLNYPLPEGYHMLVPKQQAQLISMTVNSLPEENFQNLEKHLIKDGESLSVIAKLYGTTITAIQNANNLTGNKIVAGRTLLIPLHNDDKKPIARTQTSQKQAATKPKEASGPYFYVVAMGDSFWKIASRNNTTVNRLAIINDRNPNQPLQPGESILID